MLNSDHLSKKLDDTSGLLNKLVRTTNLCEPQGFFQFTYQHPLQPLCQSCIDYFLVSQHLAHGWAGTTCFCAFSDHQAIVLFPKRLNTQGAGLWHLSNDLLQNTKCLDSIHIAIQKFSQNEEHSVIDNWLLLKCECKNIFQQFSKF